MFTQTVHSWPDFDHNQREGPACSCQGDQEARPGLQNPRHTSCSRASGVLDKEGEGRNPLEQAEMTWPGEENEWGGGGRECVPRCCQQRHEHPAPWIEGSPGLRLWPEAVVTGWGPGGSLARR